MSLNIYIFVCIVITRLSSCPEAKKINLVFRATVFKTIVRVNCFFVFVFLRIETSIMKTPTKKYGIFVKKSPGSADSDR